VTKEVLYKISITVFLPIPHFATKYIIAHPFLKKRWQWWERTLNLAIVIYEGISKYSDTFSTKLKKSKFQF